MSGVAQLKDAWDLHQMRALNAAEFAAPKARILADPTPTHTAPTASSGEGSVKQLADSFTSLVDSVSGAVGSTSRKRAYRDVVDGKVCDDEAGFLPADLIPPPLSATPKKTKLSPSTKQPTLFDVGAKTTLKTASGAQYTFVKPPSTAHPKLSKTKLRCPARGQPSRFLNPAEMTALGS